jgi:hypothetical protein
MILEGTIVVGDLADDAVETAKIADANVTTAKIADTNVTNAKLDKTNIPLSGFAAATDAVALGANKLTGVADPTAAQDAATKAYVDATNSTNANLTGMVTSSGNATTVVTNANLTGDVTSLGNATTIGNDKVVSSMILEGTIVVGDLADDAVETAKIADANVTTAKILDANVTNAKLDKTNIPLSGFAAATDAVALGANKLTGVADPTAAQDAATKAYVDAGITSGTSATVSTVDNHIQSSTNDNNAATSGTEYSATASIAAGSRTFNSANSVNTFNAGIDLNSNSIVSITLSKAASVTSGPSTYNIQPVVTNINTTNNTFTITTYAFGSELAPNTDFTFNFFVIK